MRASPTPPLDDVPTRLRRVAYTLGTPFAKRLAELSGGTIPTREEVARLMTDVGLNGRDVQKDAAVAVALECIRQAIADRTLTDTELGVIRAVKRMCGVEEGDILRLREEEVADLLREAMELILADTFVSSREASYKVALQEAFDLSYDEFYALTLDQLNVALRALLEKMAPGGRPLTPSEFEEFQVRAAHLDTVLRLDLTGEGVGNAPGRYISAAVKNAVWRRDHGRCVHCGSQERLEFDHIIPYSRGGSNSYRNIQLLCESCNRRKSASIS